MNTNYISVTTLITVTTTVTEGEAEIQATPLMVRTTLGLGELLIR